MTARHRFAFSDLGMALANATGREPRFVAIPRKRLVETLQSGQADVLCNFIFSAIARGF